MTTQGLLPVQSLPRLHLEVPAQCGRTGRSPHRSRRIRIHPLCQRDGLFPVGLPSRCLVQHTFVRLFSIAVASAASGVQGLLEKLVFENFSVRMKLTLAVWPFSIGKAIPGNFIS